MGHSTRARVMTVFFKKQAYIILEAINETNPAGKAASARSEVMMMFFYLKKNNKVLDVR